MSAESNEKMGWKETITTVAAVAAILVAAMGYYQFVEWKAKTEKDFEKLQGKMENNFEKLQGKLDELNKEFGKAEIALEKNKLQVIEATDKMGKLFEQSKADAKIAKDEIDRNKEAVAKMTAEAKQRLDKVDILVKEILNLGEENRQLVLDALKNVKASDVGDLRAQLLSFQRQISASLGDLKNERLAIKTTTFRIYAKIPSPGPGTLPAEQWSNLDRAALQIPNEAMIIGALVTCDGVHGTLKSDAHYRVPPVEVESGPDHVSLRPRDVGEAQYNQAIFVHCLYKLPK